MRLKLQPASPIPTYLQIVEQIRHGIAVGHLKADDELPSVGALPVALPALGTALMHQSPFSSFPFWLPFFEETGGHRRRHLPEYRSFEHEVNMIEQRLIARAMRAYFIAP